MKGNKIEDASKETSTLEEDKFSGNNKINLENLDSKGFNTKSEILNLVGKNKSHFEKTFKKIDEGRSKFNWCGFLFAMGYIVYRKMFKQYLKSSILAITFIIIYTILMIISIINPFSLLVIIGGMIIDGICTIVTLGQAIYIGVTFNKRYYKHLQKLNNSGLDSESLKLQTGVSGKRLAAVIIIPTTLIVVAFTVFPMIYILGQTNEYEQGVNYEQGLEMEQELDVETKTGTETKQTEEKNQDLSEIESPLDKHNENNKNNENVYEYMLSVESGFKNIDNVLREPEKYKDKLFTFSGKVLKSQTDGELQKVILETDYLSNLIMGADDYNNDKQVVELHYDFNSFGGKRMIKDDKFTITGSFKELINSEIYGDIPIFEALATGDTGVYLAYKALKAYFDGIGVNISDSGLNIIEPENLVEEIGVDNADTFNNRDSYVFSTLNGNYWAAEFRFNLRGDYFTDIGLFLGNKDESGNIEFSEAYIVITHEIDE